MIEAESNGQPVFGLAMPHPQEAEIRSNNADRIARRKAAAALAASVAQTSGIDLDRRETPRKVGGTFERLQKVPRRKTPENTGMSMDDLMQFISSFNFGQVDTSLSTRQFFSSFGPSILGITNPGPNSFGTS